MGNLSNYTIGGDDDTPKIPLLNGSNWQYWEMMMKAYLQSKGLWPWVNGTKMSHPLTTKEQQQLDSGKVEESTAKLFYERMVFHETWVENNSKALGYKLSPSLQHHIKSTAIKTWESLEGTYGKPGAAGILQPCNAYQQAR